MRTLHNCRISLMEIMKTFVLLAVFLFASAYAESDESKSLEVEDVQEIAEFVRDKFNSTVILDAMRLAKLAQDKCPDIERKLEAAADKTTKCVGDIELGSETFCSLIRNNWAKCSKPMVDAIASCLPEESKDLPSMFSRVFLSVLDQACNSTVEEILELVNPCGTLDVSSEEELPPACDEVGSVFKNRKDELLSKNFVCSMLPKLRNCAEAQEENCKNPITKRARTHFHDAVEDAIKGDCDALNKA